jgi:hypothetical protein
LRNRSNSFKPTDHNLADKEAQSSGPADLPTSTEVDSKLARPGEYESNGKIKPFEQVEWQSRNR